MDELELPPRLNPGQVPTARQVHQLLQRFSDTMKRRSAQENQKVFDKILELVDRIGTERKFEATGNTEIDERYAQHQMYTHMAWIRFCRPKIHYLPHIGGGGNTQEEVIPWKHSPGLEGDHKLLSSAGANG